MGETFFGIPCVEGQLAVLSCSYCASKQRHLPQMGRSLVTEGLIVHGVGQDCRGRKKNRGPAGFTRENTLCRNMGRGAVEGEKVTAGSGCVIFAEMCLGRGAKKLTPTGVEPVLPA